ncbi:hypothetical protein EC968_004742 [Mortierella alpina]|nr:hypothetical protein EC968_004742 [Mortierella alpina]
MVLRGLRYSLVVLATIVLAMDFATLGMGIAITVDSRSYALPLTSDFLVIILYTILAVNSPKLTLFKRARSRLVSGFRVAVSLFIAALVLYNPVYELHIYKSLIQQVTRTDMIRYPDEISDDYDWLFNALYFCHMDEYAEAIYSHCVVSRVRSLLAVFITLTMLVELGVAYRSRDYRSQRALKNEEKYEPMNESLEKLPL